MSIGDPRKWLERGQRELRTGQLDRAREAFETATMRFAGPAEMLGGGHGLRGLAQVSMAERAWDDALALLAMAERTYGLGLDAFELPVLQNAATEPVRLGLLEGRATVATIRVDLEMRRNQLDAARAALDGAYPLYQPLKGRPCVADLWMTTARLAEREGRWMSARTAWSQVSKIRRASHDEVGECDALIRLTEALIVEAELDKARMHLERAEGLARELADDTLRGRVHIASAEILEREGATEAAWEKWLDADFTLRSSSPLLRGLSKVRMARSAVRVRPAEADAYLQHGLEELLDARHPDAVGLVLHQRAVISLVNGDAPLGLVAALAAERSRGGDDRVRGVLLRALLQLREFDAAYKVALVRHAYRPEDDRAALVAFLRERLTVVPDLEGASLVRLRAVAREAINDVVAPHARQCGLELREMGTRRSAAVLTGAATERGAAQRVSAAQPDLEPRPVLTWEIVDGEPQVFVLPEGVSFLGRGSENAVAIGWDAKVSRVHAAVEVVDDVVVVRDVDSTTGVFVQGKKVPEARFSVPASFRLGDTTIGVAWRRPAQATRAAVQVAIAS